MSADPQDTEPAETSEEPAGTSGQPAEPSGQPAEPQRRSGPSRLALALTVVVVWVAVVQVLEDRSPEPADVPSGPVVSDPNAVDVAPGVRLAPDVDDPDWDLRSQEDLSRLDALRWTDLVEVNADGVERAYHGKLTLVFGEGVTEAWPILDGAVTVAVRPAQMKALIRSEVLSVRFKNHPPVDHDYSWLRPFGSPQVLDSQVGDEGAVVTVRNPTIVAKTVRMRAGWRGEHGWIGGDPSASVVQDVPMGPGETRVLTLSHATSESGELATPTVRTVLDPQPSP